MVCKFTVHKHIYALHATLQFSNHRLVGLEANLSSKNIMFGIRVACKSASELLALTTVPFWEALRSQQENGGWGVEVGLSLLETNFTPEQLGQDNIHFTLSDAIFKYS